MSRHVNDTPYLGYEVSVYEESSARHHVDVKDGTGSTLAAYTGFTDDTDATLAGKAYVDGMFHERNVAKVRPLPKGRATHDPLMVRVKDVLQEAAGLLSDDGDTNFEYDRALIELTGRLIGLDLSVEETRTAILAMLRATA